MKKFADRLRMLREQMAMNKAQMSRFLGLKRPQTYHRYEQGRLPDPEILEQIASRCGVSMDWLMGRDAEGGSSVLKEPRTPYSARTRLGGVASRDGQVTLLVNRAVREAVSTIAVAYGVDANQIYDALENLLKRPGSAGPETGSDAKMAPQPKPKDKGGKR